MSILSFQMPNKVLVQEIDESYGIFEFKPLERGYGTTIGNALRRILLSSLEGYAIVGAYFPNVLHEFSTIKGVMEDMTEIILNLKQVRFKKIHENEDPVMKINIDINNQEQLKAGDINKFTNDFEVLNPDFIICRMDSSVRFQMDLTLSKGRGYISAEENTNANELLGFIALDAIFTPIKNVKYNVENTRVEQRTDFEKLILYIKTDGSIHPEDAIKEASNILIKHFRLFSDKNMTSEQEKERHEDSINEEYLHMRKLLKTPISELNLSVRAYNALKAAGIRTLGDLVSLEISYIMKLRNFGKKSYVEIIELLDKKNLSLGMDITEYKLDEE